MQPGGGEPGTSVDMNKPVVEPRYHNPCPLVQLICCANKATVVVEVGDYGICGYWVPNFCPNQRVLLRIWVEDPFTGSLLCLKGTGGTAIPHKGYIKANLTIPGLPWYNKDVLFLVILDHKYGERVSVEIGPQVIDHLVMTISKEELQ